MVKKRLISLLLTGILLLAALGGCAAPAARQELGQLQRVSEIEEAVGKNPAALSIKGDEF